MEKRKKAEEVFNEYISSFETGDEKIRIKKVHTREVVKVTKRLSDKLEMDEKMKELVYIAALFHDIGRFKQVKMYGTYLDANSIDHAKLGVWIIEKENLLSFLNERQRYMVLKAVLNHNRYEIEKGLDEETKTLCHVIRDGDKCDIFRVFAEDNIKEMIGENEKELEEGYISDKVFETFMENRSILKSDRKTGLDICVGFLAFFFDMHFDQTVLMMKEDGRYLEKIKKLHFKNEKTEERMGKILSELESYIEKRMKHGELSSIIY